MASENELNSPREAGGLQQQQVERLEAEIERLNGIIKEAGTIMRILWDALDEPWPRLLNWIEKYAVEGEKSA